MNPVANDLPLLEQLQQQNAELEQQNFQLFNEAEVTAVSAPQTEAEIETISYTRRKTSGKREFDLAGLPVEQRFYRLSEDEQTCACCDGAMHVMSTETRRELLVIPAQLDEFSEEKMMQDIPRFAELQQAA